MVFDAHEIPEVLKHFAMMRKGHAARFCFVAAAMLPLHFCSVAAAMLPLLERLRAFLIDILLLLDLSQNAGFMCLGSKHAKFSEGIFL